jgi:hypothetical protein
MVAPGRGPVNRAESGAAGVCGVRCSIGAHADKPKRGTVSPRR